MRYAIAVAEAGGFAAAARRLNVAQPALSRQIADLEREIGHCVFERSSLGVRPTAAGVAFLAKAKATLDLAEESIEEARRTAAGETGHLRVGFNPTVSWRGVIPDTFRAFQAAKPRVRLTMLPMMSAKQTIALAAGTIDAGFLYGRPRTGDRFSAIEVLCEPLKLAVSKDDPLAALPEPVSVAALRGQCLVWFEREISPPFHDEVMALLARRDAGPGNIQKTTDTSAMLALVNAGAGYCFVPASAEWRKPGDVVLKDIDEQVDQRLELVWQSQSKSPALFEFIECARAQAARTR